MQAKRRLTALLLLLALGGVVRAQRAAELRVFCDSLTSRLERSTGVKETQVQLKSITRLGGRADLYFSHLIGEFPWHAAKLQWLRDTLQTQVDVPIGKMFCGKIDMDDLLVPEQGNDGKASADYLFRCEDPNPGRSSFIEKAGARRFKKGLSGRHIALWQSHGRYYDEKKERWSWQRAPLFRTVEDLYTQSYVLPFLIPMLENAGAYVLTPRERDIQVREIICDADPSYGKSTDPMGRTHGKYEESGSWRNGPAGFADRQEHYTFDEHPFQMGGTRLSTVRRGKANASATWTPVIQEKGEYAVYVSYPSLPESSRAARYTVRHAGGESVFYVDQRKGGSTWMYLGTFSFAPGTDGCVILDNGIPEGRAVAEGSVVGADAVKFGGGMGKTTRGCSISGLPAFAEGAAYWLNWAGFDAATVRKRSNDYLNDLSGRGAWVKHMKEERGIPFDLSLAFHSDAGTTPDSTICGTLVIYSLLNEHSRSFPDGSDRMKSRLFAQFVQDQVCRDIRASYEPQWSRRGISNRGYSESRESDIPAMILELLSHQNLADMKYGLDPGFRFQVSRAVYKGILKYLSELYGCGYAVQPLPVHHFSVLPDSAGRASLRWSPTPDPLEPTARTRGYILYTRIDDGAFDNGVEVADSSIVLDIEAGHIYSYKVEAWGDGGRSFPSEILAIGKAPADTAAPLLIVNNFTRVSGPALIEKGDYALFDDRIDSGVPYLQDISFVGEMYGTDRQLPWVSNDDAGFGASWTDRGGSIIAGNRFDYCYTHGAAAMACGHSFCSQSLDAFARDSVSNCATVDLICGKQASTLTGRGTSGIRFEVFPAALRQRLSELRRKDGRLLISGANIASDIWRPVCELRRSEEEQQALKTFLSDTLGYRFASANASRRGSIDGMEYWNVPNAWEYCVENPDGLRPASGGKTLLRYDDSNAGAAVCYEEGNYRLFAAGFPLESLKDAENRKKVMEMALNWLFR